MLHLRCKKKSYYILGERLTLVFSVSGYHNLEKAKAAGAAIILAEISKAGSMPMLMKAAKTVPAITQGLEFHSRQFSEREKHFMNQIQPPYKINTIKMRVLLVEKTP